MLERKNTSSSSKPSLSVSRPSLMRMSTQPVLGLQGDVPHSPAVQNNNSFRSVQDIKEEQEVSGVLPMPVIPPQAEDQSGIRPVSQLARVIYIDRNHTSNHSSQTQHQPVQPSLFAFRQESLRGGNRTIRIPSSQELPQISRVPSLQNMPRVPSQFAVAATNNYAPRVPSAFGVPRIPSVLQLPPDNNILPIDDIGEIEEQEPIENNQNVERLDQDFDQQNPATVLDIGENQASAEDAAGRQDQDVEDYRVRRQAIRRVALQFTLNIVFLVIYILGFLYIRRDISINVIFGFFLGFSVLYIAWSIITGGFADRYNKAKVALSVLNTLALIAYIVIAFIKYKGVDIPLSPFVLPGVALVFASCCKYSTEQPSSGTVLLIIQKVVLWAQLLLIGLNVDDVGISWIAVFIPLYFAFMVMAFSSVIIICGAIFSFFTIARSEGSSSKLWVGTVWYLLNALYTAVWLVILADIVGHLDSDREDWTVGLKVGFGHSGFLLVFTFIFWNMLIQFQQFEIQSEMLASDRNAAAAAAAVTEEQLRRAPLVKFKVYKENKSNLVMISPTFYTFFRRQKKAKDQKENAEEVERLRKDIELARMQRYRGGLMMQTAHKSADPGIFVRNNASSPARPVRNRNLDLSDGDIHMRQIPEMPEIRPTPQAPVIKRGETTENLCTICFDSVPNAVFMDCGHGGVCYECALENWKKTDNCLMCRKKINRVLKIVHFKPLNVIKVVESTRKIVGSH